MTIQIAREETRCHHMGYSFRFAARVLLYAATHRQDSIYHILYYTSRGALAGTRNSSVGPLWRIDLTTHRTMSERAYHGAISRSPDCKGSRLNKISVTTATHNNKSQEVKQLPTVKFWSKTITTTNTETKKKKPHTHKKKRKKHTKKTKQKKTPQQTYKNNKYNKQKHTQKTTTKKQQNETKQKQQQNILTHEQYKIFLYRFQNGLRLF